MVLVVAGHVLEDILYGQESPDAMDELSMPLRLVVDAG
jgi:hypothetical protein